MTKERLSSVRPGDVLVYQFAANMVLSIIVKIDGVDLTFIRLWSIPGKYLLPTGYIFCEKLKKLELRTFSCGDHYTIWKCRAK